MASATILTETCSFGENLDDLNDVEFSNIDSSFIMSLLDDSQVEGGDDQRLISVIQSLEAEIMTPNLFLETNSKDYAFPDVEQMDCCSTSSDHVYFEGIDVDVSYMSMLIDDMTSYFIHQSADEMESVVEFVGLRDYSQVCCGVAMEEDDYSGLWQ
ncbi:UNVERIFIED_CONTAM: hypothetical protein Sradi_5311900 [Sesamum radiatum]|uniref:Uncharacterized protein n=1 Tax=Sesamum radiatum TaxID=300843 RepID=A0AAW2LMX0_SESRA